MVDWSGRLDGFLHVNAYDVLENFGHVNREHAVARALADSEKFRVIQDKGFSSGFGKFVNEVKTKRQLPPYQSLLNEKINTPQISPPLLPQNLPAIRR